MGNRNVGDTVDYRPPSTRSSATLTTSATVAILSVNTTGAQCFTLTNYGSTGVYIEASFAGGFFPAGRIAVTDPTLASTVVLVSSIPASSIAKFEGAYAAVRVVASGSGVYRAELTYR